MFVIGLTGGIASGKSTIARFFIDYDVEVFDADAIARDLVQSDPTVLIALCEHFGNTILDDKRQLKRLQLRDIIFNDPVERKWLESTLHPKIRQRLNDNIAQCQSAYCIAMIPLLLESENPFPVDRILVVETQKNLQIARAVKRDKVSATAIQQIISTQCSTKTRLEAADDTLYNNNDVKKLAQEVKKLHSNYLALAKQKKISKKPPVK